MLLLLVGPALKHTSINMHKFLFVLSTPPTPLTDWHFKFTKIICAFYSSIWSVFSGLCRSFYILSGTMIKFPIIQVRLPYLCIVTMRIFCHSYTDRFLYYSRLQISYLCLLFTSRHALTFLLLPTAHVVEF